MCKMTRDMFTDTHILGDEKRSGWRVISSERKDEGLRFMIFDIEQADTPELARAEYRAVFAWGTRMYPGESMPASELVEVAYFDSVEECKAWHTAMVYTVYYDNLKHAQPFIPERDIFNWWLHSTYAITFDKK